MPDLTVSSSCPKCREGVLFNVSSRLAIAVGVLTLQCDNCKATYAVRPAPLPPPVPTDREVWADMAATALRRSIEDDDPTEEQA